jgi:2-polyprenyl-3-methyl-5-hydroxy-6-metoxy-1,4-benzoquinol methylase
MPDYNNLPAVLSKLQNAAQGADLEEIRRCNEEIRIGYPFVRSLLGDTLDVLQNSNGTEARSATAEARAQEALSARLDSLRFWNPQANETIKAVDTGAIAADLVKPHVRKALEDYSDFYQMQSNRYLKRLEQVAPVDPVSARPFRRLSLTRNINHAFRRAHVVHLVELLFGLIAAKNPEQKIRWLDIGCGTGDFANSVHPARYGAREWDILGCDLQSGKIELANAQRSLGRTFIVGDAFEILEKVRAQGQKFDIVTMFEFLEHLEDPLKFISQLGPFDPTFVYAASPLAQKLGHPFDAKPDKVHLWSFTLRGWEKMFELAGMKPVYSSEVRVGSYVGGLDWLGIVCGPQAEIMSNRQDWGR